MRKDRKRRLRRLAQRVLARKNAKLQNELTGTIRMTHSGFGFVMPDNPESSESQDIFIPAKFIHGALDGDQVRIALLPPRKGYPED